LVNPLGSCIPSLRIGVYRSSEEYGGDLALDVRLEALAELYYQGLGVSVSGVRDQGQETVQVVVHCLVSLIIRGAFQSINNVCFYIDQKELTPELLFKVGPGLDRKDASVHLLAKEVLGPSRSSFVTNFIWPYLHQFFIYSHSLNGYGKPLKRPFDIYQSCLEAINNGRDIRQINW